MNYTQQDLNVRLQLTQCAVASSTNSLLSKIKIGASDSNYKLIELQTIQGMLDAAKCYNVLGNGITEDDNCLNEDELQSIFDYISSKLNICFQYPGFNYSVSPAPDYGQFDDSFDDSFG